MLRLIAALFLPISVCCSSQRLYQHPRTGLAVFNTETPELSHDLFSTRGKEENDPQCMILRGGAVEKRGSTEPNAVTLVHDTKRNNPHCQKSHYTGSTATRMPTFFGSRDSALDRYAACLAATEGLRRHRDAQIELVSVDQRRRRLGSRKSARRIILQAKNKAAANYFRDSTKVIQSMGMLVSEFNDIGQTLQRDASLKEKVRYFNRNVS